MRKLIAVVLLAVSGCAGHQIKYRPAELDNGQEKLLVCHEDEEHRLQCIDMEAFMQQLSQQHKL